MSSSTRAPSSSNIRKRGHQHHPRNEGSRKRGTNIENNSNITSNPPLSLYSNENVLSNQQKPPICASQQQCDNEVVINCDETKQAVDVISQKCNKDEQNKKIRKRKKTPQQQQSNKEINNELLDYDKTTEDMSLIYRPAAEGSSQSDQENDNKEETLFDPEIEELSRLRCTSERTEVVAERETRRRNRRCADYPGLAFASSIFSSDTLMKFSIIRNELHNIMNTQLKRVRNLKWGL